VVQPQEQQLVEVELVVGVLSNSDERVGGVLRGLGVSMSGSEEPHRGIERNDGGGGGDRDGEVDVDFVLTSWESGHEKPSPFAFEAAVQRARGVLRTSRSTSAASSTTSTTAAPAEGNKEASMIQIHIGDDLRTDYDGALAAGTGWSSLLLDRQGAVDLHLHRGEDAGDGPRRPVQRIRRLTDAEPFLLRLCKGF
jgi:HAD-hyrolase-like